MIEEERELVAVLAAIWGQEKVARRYGVSQSTVSRVIGEYRDAYERGLEILERVGEDVEREYMPC